MLFNSNTPILLFDLVSIQFFLKLVIYPHETKCLLVHGVIRDDLPDLLYNIDKIRAVRHA